MTKGPRRGPASLALWNESTVGVTLLLQVIQSSIDSVLDVKQAAENIFSLRVRKTANPVLDELIPVIDRLILYRVTKPVLIILVLIVINIIVVQRTSDRCVNDFKNSVAAGTQLLVTTISRNRNNVTRIHLDL
jgi:hypothetical protein